MTDSEDTDGSLTFAPQEERNKKNALFKLECFSNEALLFQKYLNKAGLSQHFDRTRI